MYRCELCEKVSQPKEKCIVTPVEYREKYYKEHGTKGFEIVKEMKLCSKCAGLISL